MNKRSESIPLIIFLFLLNITVFAAFLPFNDGGWVAFIAYCLQLFIIFVNHCAIRDFRLYNAVTGLLLLSNTVSCIIIGVWANNKIQEVQQIPASGGTDILGVVMATAAFGMVEIFVIAVTVIVFVESAVSFGIRLRKYRKSKNDIKTM